LLSCIEDLRFLSGQSNTILLLTVHNQSVDLAGGTISRHLHTYTLFTAVKPAVIGELVIYSEAAFMSHVLPLHPSSCNQRSFCFHKEKLRNWNFASVLLWSSIHNACGNINAGASI